MLTSHLFEDAPQGGLLLLLHLTNKHFPLSSNLYGNPNQRGVIHPPGGYVSSSYAVLLQSDGHMIHSRRTAGRRPQPPLQCHSSRQHQRPVLSLTCLVLPLTTVETRLDRTQGETPRNSPLFPSTLTMCRAERNASLSSSRLRLWRGRPLSSLTVGEEAGQVQSPPSKHGAHGGRERFMTDLEPRGRR